MITVDINNKNKPNRWGYNIFTFQANRNRINPRGGKGTHGSSGLCNPTTDDNNNWVNGSACTYWDLQNGNQDYIKCINGDQSYCSTAYTVYDH